MAYIGTRPTVGNFVKLDTITTSATTTFNLTNGGVAYYPQSPNHCLVSLNGILQAPTDSFTISGSTIIFSSALTTSDVIDFIIVLGDVLNIGTPSDDTVTTAKLASGLVVPYGKGGTGLTTLGTASQVLRVNSGATALEFGTVSAGFTSGTAVTGSGSVIDFTSLPSTAKHIIIGIKEVVTSDNGKLGVQLGTSSGITTSGYKGSGIYVYSIGVDAQTHTNGFFAYSGSTSHVWNGIIEISNLNANVWVSSSNLYLSDSGRLDSGGGSISLASTLDRLRITTHTGGSITSGTINIKYI